MAKKILRQPTAEEQRMLKDVTAGEASFVMVRGRRWKVEWMRNITLDFVSRVMLRRDGLIERVGKRLNRFGTDGAEAGSRLNGGAEAGSRLNRDGMNGAEAGSRLNGDGMKVAGGDEEIRAASDEADCFSAAYSADPVGIGGEENKVVCKCAALMRLNGFWGIKLLYWWLWRWYYYVKQYDESDLGEYIAECKKKVRVVDYLMCTTLLTAMMDTKKQMNRAEVNRIQVEQLSAQRAALGKSTRN